MRAVRHVLSLVALTLAACADAPVPSAAGTELTDSAGVAIAFSVVDTAAACETTERVRIGSAAGDSTTQLFGVRDAATLPDGRMAVLNRGSSQVKIFASDGRFVRQFGREGEGPGEFLRNLWSLHLRGGDTLVVGEYRPWRFSLFTVGGAWVRSVEMRPRRVERPDLDMPLSPGRGFLVGERCCGLAEGTFEDQTLVVVHHGPDGSTADTVGSFWFTRYGFLDEELGFVGGPIFGARASFAPYLADTLAYASGRSDQVELWTPDGALRRIVRWRARDRDVRAEDVQEWKRAFRERVGSPSSPQGRRVLEAQVGDHRPVAERFPAVAEWGALHATDDGTLWVKEYRRPSDTGPDRWLVFGPDGAFACQARTPEGLAVFDVGEDYVLGMLRDDLDVEYVLAYDVTPPGG